MGREIIRTPLATLKPLGEGQIAAASKVLSSKQAKERLLTKHDYTPEVLKKFAIDGDALGFWEIWPEGAKAAVGYCGYRLTAGPLIVILFNDGKYDVDLAQDIISVMIEEFFVRTLPKIDSAYAREGLSVHVPREVEDDMHGFLIQNGFDPYGGPHVFVDGAKYASYRLEAATYEAYYGEGAVEEGAEEGLGEDEG